MELMRLMIEEQQPDVICFQELWFPASTYIPDNYKKVVGSGLEHPIYVRRGLVVGQRSFHIHWSMAQVEGYYIFSIHGHWDRKKTEKLFADIHECINKLSKNQEPSCILTGDYNVEWNELKELASPLLNIREVLNQERQITYMHFVDNTRVGEIDHFLYCNCTPLSYSVFPDKEGKFRISDHYPIVAEFAD